MLRTPEGANFADINDSAMMLYKNSISQESQEKCIRFQFVFSFQKLLIPGEKWQPQQNSSGTSMIEIFCHEISMKDV